MSDIEGAVAHEPGVDPSEATPQGPARPGRALLIWATTACLLLGASGVVRAIQERRHKTETDHVEACPFPLKSIPMKLGGWQANEGEELTLDPLTMRITGGSDYVLRTYVNKLTGVSLVVLVLFGPAEPVLPHTPEACYPSSGYSHAKDAMDRRIGYDAVDASGNPVLDAEGRPVKRQALFRTSFYEKSGALSMRREEAYHSFRLEGQWSYLGAAGRKLPRRDPGVFKVQIQRMVTSKEGRSEQGSPTEQFLSLLVGEIERDIALGSAAPAGKADRPS